MSDGSPTPKNVESNLFSITKTIQVQEQLTSNYLTKRRSLHSSISIWFVRFLDEIQSRFFFGKIKKDTWKDQIQRVGELDLTTMVIQIEYSWREFLNDSQNFAE